MPRAGLYIHIPFCLRKCAYCDFVSFPGREALHAAYGHALLLELARRAPAWAHLSFDTLFLGGGTPTVLPADALCRLVTACRQTLALPPDAEISLEANPGTVDVDALRALREAGVSRLSLGVQSLDGRLLLALGRIHTSEQAMAAYHAARAVGMDNINLDLMFGLPAQSLANWRSTLQTVLALEPEHLSLYALTLEEGTPLAERIAAGACPAPDDNLAADMYELAEETLDHAGYAHYEISNWARRDAQAAPDDEAVPHLACRHNLGYWRNEPYLGLGVAAHSFDGLCRSANTSDLDEYLARTPAGQEATVSCEEGDRAREMSDTMMLGLRLMVGVTWVEFARRFGVEMRSVYGRQIAQLVEDDLLAADARGIRLTRRGHLLGNRVFVEFLL
jgi:oxygen-independent coproporphyrinogen-3 oxidase